MHARNAASVLPDPVGAEISVLRPARMCGQPMACGSVGVANRWTNHSRTSGCAHSRPFGALMVSLIGVWVNLIHNTSRNPEEPREEPRGTLGNRYDLFVTDRETLDLDILIVGGGPAGHVRRASAGATAEGAGRRAAGDRRARQGARARRARALGRGARSVARSGISSPISRRRARRSPRPVQSRRRVLPDRARASCGFPITPPPLRNHGNYIISLNKFVKWLAGQVEAAGIDIFSGLRGVGGAVRRATASSACARAIAASTSTAAASPRSSPASTSARRSTIFCDGVRGNLTKTLVSKLKLDEGRMPQLYALGIKELWEVPAGSAAGRPRHSHDGLSAADGGVRRRLHLRDAGRPAVGRIRRRASTTRTRCSIRT